MTIKPVTRMLRLTLPAAHRMVPGACAAGFLARLRYLPGWAGE